VVSPGGLYGTVTSDNLATPGYSSARNQYLLSLLESVPFTNGFFVENRKAGFQVICDELEQAGMPRPKAEDHVSFFTVTLYRASAVPRLKQERDELCIYLATVGEATASEIAEALGISRRSASYRLSQLIEQGKVERVGKARSPKQTYRLRQKSS